MKRFLSLVLTLVMVMSLVTVSAGAKDFTDGDKITYEEAVSVISTIGVVDGDTNGAFRPTDTLTRQAAAKIICNLILGPTTAAELHADTAPYKDVAVNNQFAGYIAYCQSKGIISGYADGTFRPTGTLTGYAFMKMLLGALGYDSSLEGYVGTNWSINVAKQALGLKLNKGLEGEFNGIKAVTREEACLYAFRTIQADLVEYNQRVTTNINGTEVTLSSGGAQSRKWDSQQSRYDYIRDDNIIQFAEEYFNKLEKKKDTDDFERPAYTWVYDKKTIGTYVDWELMVEEYTSGVSGRDVYDLLGSAIIRDNTLTYYVDGVVPSATHPANVTADIVKNDLVRSNQDDLGVTDDGVLTQVFLDKDAGAITIVSVNTWLAQATADYNESKEYAPLNVFYAYANKKITEKSWNVDVEDVPSVVDVKNEDYYLVNITWKNDNNGDVVMIQEPDIMEDSAVTKFSVNSAKLPTKLTTGGTEYKKAAKAYYDAESLDEYDQSLLTDKTYTVYMDQYGYFIGVELYEGTKNYVFITGFDRPTSNISIKTADAVGIFLDGTMDQIKVNVTDTNKNIARTRNLFTSNDALTAAEIDEAYGAGYFARWGTSEMDNQVHTKGTAGEYNVNRWYTYTVNASGVYTLKPANRMTATYYGNTATTIKTANVSVVDNILTGSVNNAHGAKFLFATVGTNEQNYDYNTRAYGNDDSVYITVDLDDVDTSFGPKAITDVNGVYTGVQNVELDITPQDLVGSVQEAQVYTVYDKNWFIVGAVVIGEGNGSNGTVVRLMDTKVKSEWIEDGTYYWDVDVYDGAQKTLTIKSKYSTVIDDIMTDADRVVELRMDSDGYVTKVLNLDEPKDVYNDYSDGAALKIDDAKIYRMNVLTGDDRPTTLEVRGNTLYVTANRTDRGLALRPEATALTIQNENQKTNVKTEFNSVSAAISHLQDNDYNAANGFQFNGQIIAALDSNGAAKWVIFIQPSDVWLTTGKDPNYTGGGIQVSIKYGQMSITAPRNVTANALAEAIEAQLIREGYTDLGITIRSNFAIDEVAGVWTITGLDVTATKGNVRYTFTPTFTPNESGELTDTAKQVGGVVVDETKPAEVATVINDLKANASAAKVEVPSTTTVANDDAGKATVATAVTNSIKADADTKVEVETVEIKPVEGSADGYAIAKVTMTKNNVKTVSYVRVNLAAAASAAPVDPTDVLLDAQTALQGTEFTIDAKEEEHTAWGTKDTDNTPAKEFQTKAEAVLTGEKYEGIKVTATIAKTGTGEAAVPRFTKAVNGTYANRAGTDGMAVVNVTLTKGGESVSPFPIDVTLKAFDYADTTAGKENSGEVVKNVTTNSTVTTTDAIRELPTGAYILTNEAVISAVGDVHGLATSNVFFVYKIPAAGEISGNTFTIKNSKGETVYTETGATGTASKAQGMYYYVQVIADSQGNPGNKGDGSMKAAGLPIGTYTWTITGTGITPASGSFTID